MLVNREGWHIDSKINTDLVEYCNKLDGTWNEQYALGYARKKGHNIHKALKLKLGLGAHKLVSDFYHERFKTFNVDNYIINEAYLLHYNEGSFTGLHHDNAKQSHKTSITLIDKSEDLVGGQPIIINHMGAPVIPEHQVGQTMWYDQKIVHGVTRVEKGHRKVLVTWWKNKDKEY